ncbi:MAG: chemotaxis protein CheW, partial [Burkholderiaceae bacterium]
WMSLRGRTVPVVRFEALLRPDCALPAPSPDQRVVIARIGDAPIGLLVDSVDDIFGFFPDDVLPIPLLGRARAGMFRGCITRDAKTAADTGGDTILLDHDALFSGAELQEITQGHAALYGAEAGAGHATRQAAGEAASRRRVYIAFAIGHAYAVEIGQVREIIGLPEQLVQAPGMPPFVHGILNLRRRMVTLVDPRRLYGMPDAAERMDARVLVIERGDECFGVVVDAVDSIVTVADAHRLRAPKILHGAADDALQGGLQEVIELPGVPAGETRTLGVFDVDAFLARLQREMGVAA